MLPIAFGLTRSPLERRSPASVVALGAVLGLAAGLALLFGLPSPWGLVACTVALAPAVVMGWRSAPLFPVESPPLEELLEMVELPGGRFLMGSPNEDEMARDTEKPQHAVEVSPFAMSKLLITRRLYREVVGGAPSEWARPGKDDLMPANWLSWYDAVAFCNALSQKTGLTPCYSYEGDDTVCDWSADGYRLPTEAEWEFAARAGTTTKWWWGDDEDGRDLHAWPRARSVHPLPDPEGMTPEDVARVNASDLHGMVGNVWHWCWDRSAGNGYEIVEPGSTLRDPRGPSGGGGSRRLRGGAYVSDSRFLRSAYRFRDHPVDRRVNIGFRCVRAPRRQHSNP